MFRNYHGLWLILALAFVIFALTSFFGPVKIGGYELKPSRLDEALVPQQGENVTHRRTAADIVAENRAQDALVTQIRAQKENAETGPAASDSTDTAAATPVARTDSAGHTILLIGDSMLEGLSPRLAAYANHNGHVLYTVMWYSSNTEKWATSHRLSSYIKRLHPSYIFICLGANELFVSDIARKRGRYVKSLIDECGSIPFVWIGPPNWKADTGINDLIAANVPSAGNFFVSNGMKFDRAADGAHPTRTSAAAWMDSVARWMPRHAATPLAMDTPRESSARPKRIFVHSPNDN